MGHLVSFWYSMVVVVRCPIAVDKQPELQSFITEIAVVDSVRLIVSRQRVKEVVCTYVEPILMYRKLVLKRVVSKLIRVVVRISEQLL